MADEQRPVPKWPALLGLLPVLPGVKEVLQAVVIVGGSLAALVLSALQVLRFRFSQNL